MKKLKYLFCFLFVLFALGSISVFAADTSTVPFEDYFRVYRFLAHNVPSEDFDYIYSTNDNDLIRPGVETSAVWKGDSLPPEAFAYSFRTTFSRQNENGNPIQDATLLPPGYFISGTFHFDIGFWYPNDYGDVFDPKDLQHAIVMLYDYPDGEFWSITGRQKLSDIKFLSSSSNGDFGTIWRCSADFYFYNDTNEYIDMRRNSFQFMFRFKNSSSFPNVYRYAFFADDITDFYYGKANNPSAPSFKDYEVYNDVIEKEDELVEDALKDYSDAIDKYKKIAESLDPFDETSSLYIFASSLLFITELFEFILAKINLLESLLFVSIFFGLSGFFLNILPSMVSTFKHRGEAEKVSKNKKGDSA